MPVAAMLVTWMLAAPVKVFTAVVGWSDIAPQINVCMLSPFICCAAEAAREEPVVKRSTTNSASHCVALAAKLLQQQRTPGLELPEVEKVDAGVAEAAQVGPDGRVVLYNAVAGDDAAQMAVTNTTTSGCCWQQCRCGRRCS